MIDGLDVAGVVVGQRRRAGFRLGDLPQLLGVAVVGEVAMDAGALDVGRLVPQVALYRRDCRLASPVMAWLDAAAAGTIGLALRAQMNLTPFPFPVLHVERAQPIAESLDRERRERYGQECIVDVRDSGLGLLQRLACDA